MKKFVVNDNKEEKVEKFEISKPSSNEVEVKTKEQKNPLGKNLKQKTIELNSGKKESFKLKENNNCFESKGKLLKGRFAKSISEKELVRLDFNNHVLSLGLKEKTGKRRNDSIARVLANEDNKSSISFEEFEANTDLKYDLFEDGLKESIVVKQRQDKYEYEFILQIGDLTPVFNEEKNTFELKKDNKTIYRVMTPFMFDSNENYSDDCSYEIEEVGSGTLNLTLKASSKWINDVQRVFPITIDPTIVASNDNIISISSLIGGREIVNLNKLYQIGYRMETRTTFHSIKCAINVSKIKENAIIDDSSKVMLIIKSKSFINTGSNLEQIVAFTHNKMLSVFKIDNKDIKIDITSLIVNNSGTLNIYIASTRDINYPLIVSQNFVNSTPSWQVLKSVFSKFDNEKSHPKLIIESFEEDVDESPCKDYSSGRSGTTSINLKTGSYKHEHDDNANISHNALSLSLSHVFDNRKSDDNSSYLGKGWKTNFHQYLEKSDTFNQLLGSKDITYTDGQGKKHLLHEQWFYIDENKAKHFVNREEVYLDADQKFKYKKDDEHIYEVKYDVESDEGLSYASGSVLSLTQVQDNDKKYYFTFAGKKRRISIDPELSHSLQFYYMNGTQKVFIEPAATRYNEKGILVGPTQKAAQVDLTSPTKIQQVNGRYGFYCKYTQFHGQPDVANSIIIDTFISLTCEEIEHPVISDDIYNNEDIVQLNSNIDSIRQNINDLKISRDSIINNYTSLINQYKFKNYCQNNQDDMVAINEYVSEKQEEITNPKNNVLKQIVKNEKTLLELAIGKLEETGAFQLSDQFVLSTNNNNFTDEDEYDGSNLKKSNNSSSSAISAINYLTEKKSIALTTSTEYKNKVEEYKDIEREVQTNNYIFSYTSLIDQMATCEVEYAKVMDAINSYTKMEQDLVTKKQALIDQQKRQVNDFIIDKEGNTLGFDGYGRLIVIQDKYENKVEIEFGYEDENEGKMLSIYSDNQTIRFNYDKTSELLSSIIDAQGRKTKYSYLNDNLVSITYNDKKKTRFEYEEFSVISPTLDKTTIGRLSNGDIAIRQYCYDGRIAADTVLNEEKELKQIVDHKYTFDADYQTTTIIDEKTKKEVVCYFDHQGRVIKQVDEENTSVTFYEQGRINSQVSYKTDEEKSVLDYLTIHDGPCSYQLNLNHYEKLPFSNMLGLKLDILTGNEDNDSILSFKVKAIVNSTTSEGGMKSEVFEQEYQEVKLQTVVLPIVIDRNLSYRVDIVISSDTSDFTGSYLNAVDLIFLEEGTIYSYDAKERLIKEQNGYSTVEYSEFNEENIPLSKTEKNIYGEEVSTHYSYNANKQITLIEDSKENVVEYYYDTKGNCIEKRSYNKKDASLRKVEKTNYDEQGRVKDQTSPIKDEEGKETKTSVSYLPGTNKENKVEQANGENIAYSYDYNNGNLLSISSSASGINNSTSFTYNYGLLTSLSHHGVKVNYTYDGLGRKTVVALNDEEVMWNQYFDDYNSKNDSNYSFDREIKQGNYQDSTTLDGLFSASYSNDKGQLLYTKYSGDESVGESSYFYDEDKVSSTTSMINYRDTNQVYKEESLNTYNEFKQLVKQEKKVNDVSQVVLEDHYDETNRFVTSGDVIFSEEEYRLNYLNEYDKEHRLTSISVREGIIDDEEFFTEMEKASFKYDVLGRVTHKNISTEKMSLCHEYAYLQQDENTLDLIAEDITKIKVVNQGNTTYLTETSTYQYDVSGNITKIITDEDETRYTYDKLNRLIREDNPTLNKTITYKYDKAGNILLKKTYAYTLEGNLFSPTVDEYVYDCEGIRDRLISFNNKKISYDSMGRPTTYKDDQYEWNNQGQLTSILNQNMDDISYLYDTNGIRRKKIVNGVETSFITNGTQILSMKQGNSTFIFRYVLNKLVGFNYNNGSSTKEYIYHRNIQGDILGIYDDEGNQVGGYAYDAYGHHVVTLDINGIATLNPFRYRGYFYDEETKLYYLNARYYDPETGRFISPDILSILDETKGQINGLNLYMYCGDNPVMFTDELGYLPKWLEWLGIGAAILGVVLVIGAITVLTAGVGTTVLTGTLVGATLHGAAIGALIGAGVGIVAGGIIGGAVSGWSAEGILIGMGIGFGAGALIGAVIGAAHGAITAKVHSVYISKANGTVNYVGRTNNIIRRSAEHAAGGRGIIPQQVAKNMTLRQARGLEQALINKFGLIKNGGTLINKINSISKFSAIYEKAVAWGVKYISKFLPFL